ncbi:alanine racemase [Pseudomonas guariconensis]|uniref:Broad specificity amino-acid racemase n=1 Tax=Pseudomonas guariconensis TaxID=1288410 RepID=A0AAX0VVD4_9PSED|nr:alanine racemase [Pseudomonas guariconensis]PLV17820.1 alanine racemase [Pseudomonas guariconensis]PLV22592.1 alanine racemase [Pseudomonas guariconensis]PLV27615.1 alanine racemase [Pseudomonas guariconensis]
MKFSKSLISIALGLAMWQGSSYAAPPLTMQNGKAEITAPQSNAWVEVNKTALESNIRTLQSTLGNKSKLCAVLKADAYGHGVGLVMPSIIAMGVPCVAVASNEEARVVRESGFKGELVRVRTATLAEVDKAQQYNIVELVGDLDFARDISALAAKQGSTIKYHLSLNAGGMSRNGLEMRTEQGKKDALAITKLPHVELTGIMTHFAVEEKEDVRKGLAIFNEQSAWLIKTAGLDRSKLTLHTANTFATLEVPEARLDMVRPGAALYGDVATHPEYKRVMQFKSYVASINEYPKDNTVGYDHTFTLTRDSRLANIPVGYSDGYRRVFTNKGFVLIGGHRAPVVGKVSMNTLMVDVTDIPTAHPGDEVALFGKQGEGEITKGEIEEINGALLADLYTVWGNSNPKVLVEDKAAD